VTPIYAALILIAILAIGDLVSIITKAKVPMLFVALSIYLILIWLGMPKDLVTLSVIGPFGVVMIPVLIVHMGTLVPFHVLAEQWKAIVVAFVAMAVASVFMLLAASPIFGWNQVVAGAPSVLGGLIAALVTVEGLQNAGLEQYVVITMTILAIQSLVAMPITSNLMKKYALGVQKTYRAGEAKSKSEYSKKEEEPLEAAVDVVEKIPYGTDENPSPKYKALLPKKFEVDTVMLLKLLAGGSIAVFLGNITFINNSIWAIFIGLLGSYFGFYRGRMLNRANSFGILMVALVAYLFTTLNNVTIEVLKENILGILGILAFGTIGLIIGGFIGGWLVKWPKELAISVALAAEYGFPGNYLISNEVSRTISHNKKEREAIFDKILPPLLVGGYATVTTGSILFATILIRVLK
jgi:MFS family permease